MFAKLKGSHNGSSKNLNVNPEHVALVFNRQERVVIRMIDGVEIPLEAEYTDAGVVADMIDSARGLVNPEAALNAILGVMKPRMPDA